MSQTVISPRTAEIYHSLGGTYTEPESPRGLITTDLEKEIMSVTLPLDHPKSSILSSTFVLSATTLGAGVLALPHAYSLCGVILSTIFLLCVGIGSIFSIRLLLHAAHRVGAKSYEELGAVAFPRYGRSLVIMVTCSLIFGAMASFLVIIADTITPSIQAITGVSDSFFVKREILLTFVTVFIIFPLCLLRSVHQLERWSFLAVIIIICFSILIVIVAIMRLVNGSLDGSTWSFHDEISYFILDWNMFQALPIISLAYCCQMMLFPIWSQLKDPTVKRMQTVVNSAMGLAGAMYIVVGMFGYFAYGPLTEGDVLNNFPDNNGFYDTVRVFFAIAICIHYPVTHFGFRNAIEDGLFRNNEWTLRRHVIETVLACSTTLLVAIALPDLSSLFSLSGAISGFPYGFILPCIFYLRVHQTSRYAPMNIEQWDAQTNMDYSRTEIHKTKDTDEEQDHSYNRHTSEITTYTRQASQHLLRPLSLKQTFPVYVLLVISCIICIISIVITFKDMVNTFTKETEH